MQHVSLLSGLGSTQLGVLPLVSKYLTPEVMQQMQAQVLTVDVPAAGACSSPTRPGFIWMAGPPGYWARMQPGQTCTPAPGTVAPTVRDHTTEPQKQVAPSTVMQLGPWTIPIPWPGKSYTWLLDDYSKLTPEVTQVISQQLQTPIQKGWKSPWQVGYWQGVETKSWIDYPGQTKTFQFNEVGGEGTQTVVWPAKAPWGDYLTTRGWIDKLGIYGKIIDNGYFGGLGDPSLCGGRSAYACSTAGSSADRVAPLMKFKHPVTGEDWGVWLKFQQVGPVIESVSHTSTVQPGVQYPPLKTQSVALALTVQKLPSDPWYKAILEVIFYLPAKLFDLILSTGKDLLDLACSDPTKAMAAASAAGPEAVAAVNAAMALCPTKPPGTPDATETKVNDVTGKKAVPWGYVAGGVAFIGLLVYFLASPPRRAA